MRLYDLAEQYNDILDFLQDDSDNEKLQQMLDGLGGKIEEKIENTVKVMKSLESDVNGIDAEIKRLTSRKASLNNNISYLKQIIEFSMTSLDITKIKGSLFTVSMQNNPPKVNVIDAGWIPRDYFRVPEVVPQLDKKRLLEDLKSGIYAGPGAAIVQEKSLRVR
ncbi:siphovirus Gp157 family protein [Paenibacillus polymyxa]|uniref:siphovirus Gp157 family protein n=1 Tax=Paenibacillus polymyxa TaxID=1406 RepID=UPI002AB50205|nr:siphovirus Gp157 family protein [Paenibacillus polymyxa]MDY8046538.1 siphovirus Gp157 family protein [Paenibacillus polymyxa]